MKRNMLPCLALLLISVPTWAAEAPNPGAKSNQPMLVAQMQGTAPAAASAPAAIQPTGFWMEGHLGMSLRSTTTTPSFGSGVVLGYKVNQLVVGVGLDLTYDWNKDDSDNVEYTTTTQDLNFALGPVVEYILGKFGPVGFFLTGAGHFLVNWHKVELSTHFASRAESTKSYGFDFKTGAGGRFYLGGRVGVGLELGLLMTYTKNDGVKDFAMGPYTLLTLATIW